MHDKTISLKVKKTDERDIKKIQILISKILKSCTIPLMGERYLQNSPLQEYLEKKNIVINNLRELRNLYKIQLSIRSNFVSLKLKCLHTTKM